MVCWPFFADQAMNCRYSCNEWVVGMEIDNNVKREGVEMLVKELMEGDEGEKMREKAMEWKRLAEEAAGPKGTSSINLDKKIAREKEREMGSISKPHVVVIPCPVQGHIKTMLKFAKLLHYKGPDALDDLPGFHFRTIPDGLPPSDIDATQAIPSLCDAMNKNFLAPFTDLLLKLKNTVSEDNPPITCIVADPFAPVAIRAGEEVGLPVVMYATVNACAYMGFKQLYTLREKGFIPIKVQGHIKTMLKFAKLLHYKGLHVTFVNTEFNHKHLSDLSNGYLETKVDCAPGMKDVRLKDFPFIQTTDPDDVVFNFVMGAAETSVKARAIALHTFDALEPEVLDGLSTIFPRVYSIGPLQLLLNQIEDNGLKSIGYNLWKEDRACLQWLDTKEPKSVVYVNFGSITVMTADQLVEFAMGLANSKISFLWIIRPDLVTGESAVLPAEFAETDNRSFITSWCPQEEVLNHPAIVREKEREMGSISKPHVVVIPSPAQGHIKTMLKFAKLLHYKGLHITFVSTEFNHKRLLREMGSISKPHVVVIPCPLQGHIKTMLKFAKLLRYKGLHITFVNTEFNHKRLLRSGGLHAVDDLPGFHFETIPDGLPPSDIDATQSIPSLCDAMNKNFLAPFTDLLLKLKNTVSENNPPITCVVADPFAPFSIKAGEEVGLPVVMYATMNACGYMGFKHLYALREKGFTPIKGHIKTMLKFAKLLHYKGLHVTFVNTEFNHKRLLRSRGPDALDDLPGFHFRTIPDGLPPSDIDATQAIPSLCDAMNKNFLAPFTDLLLKLKNTVSEDNPPITCIVADPFAPVAIRAGEEVGLPVVMYATTNACGYMGFKQLYTLREKGFIIPIKDLSDLSNDYLETKVDCAPGMKDVRLKDFPFIQTTDPDDVVFNFVMGAAETSVKARAIALHTFDALEPEVLDGLSTIFPRVYSIGPLQLLLNQIEENGLKSIGYNLWKEDRACLQWLDTKEPKSVVYVNFGSITVMTADQLVEFAMGLANSKISFLWIIRPDLVTGESAVLPAEFAETENRRLNHPAVGGFLTHSGWGSTIESLCAGVPMVCWPFFSDQTMNCRYSCKEWGVGMQIDNNVKREEVEMLVKELMEGGEVRNEEKMGSKPEADHSMPHIVLIPCPLQSHIKTMLKLAKLFHSKGFHITFVNTEFNHKRFLKSRGPDALDGLPNFRFETIPDGLPPSHIDATQEIDSITMAVENNMLAPFKDLLAKLVNPAVTCIVSDAFMPFTITAAEEAGLKVVMFVSMSACGYMGYKQLHSLKEKGFFPLKDKWRLESGNDFRYWKLSLMNCVLTDESYLRNGYLENTII
uniref:Anthocyanidin 3-O-glucosyltransferase n=1 Tax=Salix viminalis TaxID=40686 RepID=A0A6N2KTD7_SALVM